MYKPPFFLEEEISRTSSLPTEPTAKDGTYRANVLISRLARQKQELTTNYASMRQIFFYFNFFEGHVWQHLDAVFACEGAAASDAKLEEVSRRALVASLDTWKILLRRALVLNQNEWNCSMGLFYYAFRCVYYLFHSKLFQQRVTSNTTSTPQVDDFVRGTLEGTVSFIIRVLQQINTLAQTRSVTAFSFSPLKNTFFDMQQIIRRVEELLYFFTSYTDYKAATPATGKQPQRTFALSQEANEHISHLEKLLSSVQETMEFMLDRYTTKTVDELLLAEYKCVDFTKGSNLATVKGFHPCVWAYFRLCCAHIRTFCPLTIYPQVRLQTGPDESSSPPLLESSVLSQLLSLTTIKMAIGLTQLIQTNHTAASAMKRERREQIIKDILCFVLLARVLRRYFFHERARVSEILRLLLRAAIQLGTLQEDGRKGAAVSAIGDKPTTDGDSVWNVQPLTLEKILFLPLYRTDTPWTSPFFLNSALAPFMSSDSGANSLANLAAEARNEDSDLYIVLIRTLRSTANCAA